MFVKKIRNLIERKNLTIIRFSVFCENNQPDYVKEHICLNDDRNIEMKELRMFRNTVPNIMSGTELKTNLIFDRRLILKILVDFMRTNAMSSHIICKNRYTTEQSFVAKEILYERTYRENCRNTCQVSKDNPLYYHIISYITTAGCNSPIELIDRLRLDKNNINIFQLSITILNNFLKYIDNNQYKNQNRHDFCQLPITDDSFLSSIIQFMITSSNLHLQQEYQNLQYLLLKMLSKLSYTTVFYYSLSCSECNTNLITNLKKILYLYRLLLSSVPVLPTFNTVSHTHLRLYRNFNQKLKGYATLQWPQCIDSNKRPQCIHVNWSPYCISAQTLTTFSNDRKNLNNDDDCKKQCTKPDDNKKPIIPRDVMNIKQVSDNHPGKTTDAVNLVSTISEENDRNRDSEKHCHPLNNGQEPVISNNVTNIKPVSHNHSIEKNYVLSLLSSLAKKCDQCLNSGTHCRNIQELIISNDEMDIKLVPHNHSIEKNYTLSLLTTLAKMNDQCQQSETNFSPRGSNMEETVTPKNVKQVSDNHQGKNIDALNSVSTISEENVQNQDSEKDCNPLHSIQEIIITNNVMNIKPVPHNHSIEKNYALSLLHSMANVNDYCQNGTTHCIPQGSNVEDTIIPINVMNMKQVSHNTSAENLDELNLVSKVSKVKDLDHCSKTYYNPQDGNVEETIVPMKVMSTKEISYNTSVESNDIFNLFLTLSKENDLDRDFDKHRTPQGNVAEPNKTKYEINCKHVSDLSSNENTDPLNLFSTVSNVNTLNHNSEKHAISQGNAENRNILRHLITTKQVPDTAEGNTTDPLNVVRKLFEVNDQNRYSEKHSKPRDNVHEPVISNNMTNVKAIHLKSSLSTVNDRNDDYEKHYLPQDGIVEETMIPRNKSISDIPLSENNNESDLLLTLLKKNNLKHDSITYCSTQGIAEEPNRMENKIDIKKVSDETDNMVNSFTTHSNKNTLIQSSEKCVSPVGNVGKPSTPKSVMNIKRVLNNSSTEKNDEENMLSSVSKVYEPHHDSKKHYSSNNNVALSNMSDNVALQSNINNLIHSSEKHCSPTGNVERCNKPTNVMNIAADLHNPLIEKNFAQDSGSSLLKVNDPDNDLGKQFSSRGNVSETNIPSNGMNNKPVPHNLSDEKSYIKKIFSTLNVNELDYAIKNQNRPQENVEVIKMQTAVTNNKQISCNPFIEKHNKSNLSPSLSKVHLEHDSDISHSQQSYNGEESIIKKNLKNTKQILDNTLVKDNTAFNLFLTKSKVNRLHNISEIHWSRKNKGKKPVVPKKIMNSKKDSLTSIQESYVNHDFNKYSNQQSKAEEPNIQSNVISNKGLCLPVSHNPYLVKNYMSNLVSTLSKENRLNHGFEKPQRPQDNKKTQSTPTNVTNRKHDSHRPYIEKEYVLPSNTNELYHNSKKHWSTQGNNEKPLITKNVMNTKQVPLKPYSKKDCALNVSPSLLKGNYLDHDYDKHLSPGGNVQNPKTLNNIMNVKQDSHDPYTERNCALSMSSTLSNIQEDYVNHDSKKYCSQQSNAEEPNMQSNVMSNESLCLPVSHNPAIKKKHSNFISSQSKVKDLNNDPEEYRTPRSNDDIATVPRNVVSDVHGLNINSKKYCSPKGNVEERKTLNNLTTKIDNFNLYHNLKGNIENPIIPKNVTNNKQVSHNPHGEKHCKPNVLPLLSKVNDPDNDLGKQFSSRGNVSETNIPSNGMNNKPVPHNLSEEKSYVKKIFSTLNVNELDYAIKNQNRPQENVEELNMQTSVMNNKHISHNPFIENHNTSNLSPSLSKVHLEHDSDIPHSQQSYHVEESIIKKNLKNAKQILDNTLVEDTTVFNLFLTKSKVNSLKNISEKQQSTQSKDQKPVIPKKMKNIKKDSHNPEINQMLNTFSTPSKVNDFNYNLVKHWSTRDDAEKPKTEAKHVINAKPVSHNPYLVKMYTLNLGSTLSKVNGLNHASEKQRKPHDNDKKLITQKNLMKKQRVSHNPSVERNCTLNKFLTSSKGNDLNHNSEEDWNKQGITIQPVISSSMMNIKQDSCNLERNNAEKIFTERNCYFNPFSIPLNKKELNNISEKHWSTQGKGKKPTLPKKIMDNKNDSHNPEINYTERNPVLNKFSTPSKINYFNHNSEKHWNSQGDAKKSKNEPKNVINITVSHNPNLVKNYMSNLVSTLSKVNRLNHGSENPQRPQDKEKQSTPTNVMNRKHDLHDPYIEEEYVLNTSLTPSNISDLNHNSEKHWSTQGNNEKPVITKNVMNTKQVPLKPYSKKDSALNVSSSLSKGNYLDHDYDKHLSPGGNVQDPRTLNNMMNVKQDSRGSYTERNYALSMSSTLSKIQEDYVNHDSKKYCSQQSNAEEPNMQSNVMSNEGLCLPVSHNPSIKKKRSNFISSQSKVKDLNNDPEEYRTPRGNDDIATVPRNVMSEVHGLNLNSKKYCSPKGNVEERKTLNNLTTKIDNFNRDSKKHYNLKSDIETPIRPKNVTNNKQVSHGVKRSNPNALSSQSNPNDPDNGAKKHCSQQGGDIEKSILVKNVKNMKQNSDNTSVEQVDTLNLFSAVSEINVLNHKTKLSMEPKRCHKLDLFIKILLTTLINKNYIHNLMFSESISKNIIFCVAKRLKEHNGKTKFYNSSAGRPRRHSRNIKASKRLLMMLSDLESKQSAKKEIQSKFDSSKHKNLNKTNSYLKEKSKDIGLLGHPLYKNVSLYKRKHKKRSFWSGFFNRVVSKVGIQGDSENYKASTEESISTSERLTGKYPDISESIDEPNVMKYGRRINETVKLRILPRLSPENRKRKRTVMATLQNYWTEHSLCSQSTRKHCNLSMKSTKLLTDSVKKRRSS